MQNCAESRGICISALRNQTGTLLLSLYIESMRSVKTRCPLKNKLRIQIYTCSHDRIVIVSVARANLNIERSDVTITILHYIFTRIYIYTVQIKDITRKNYF